MFGRGCMRGIERLFAGHIPRLAVEHQIGAVNLKGYWRNLALESIGWMLWAEFVCLGPSGAVWLRRTPPFYRVCPPPWSAAQASRRAPDRPDASLCCAILMCCFPSHADHFYRLYPLHLNNGINLSLRRHPVPNQSARACPIFIAPLARMSA